MPKKAPVMQKHRTAAEALNFKFAQERAKTRKPIKLSLALTSKSIRNNSTQPNIAPKQIEELRKLGLVETVEGSKVTISNIGLELIITAKRIIPEAHPNLEQLIEIATIEKLKLNKKITGREAINRIKNLFRTGHSRIVFDKKQELKEIELLEALRRK